MRQRRLSVVANITRRKKKLESPKKTTECRSLPTVKKKIWRRRSPARAFKPLARKSTADSINFPETQQALIGHA
jgi:hypothetical protein